MIAAKVFQPVTTTLLPLKHARTQVGLEQQDLADLSGVSIEVIRKVEQRRGRLNLMSAYKLLGVINRLRIKEGWTGLALHDIDWDIRE